MLELERGHRPGSVGDVLGRELLKSAVRMLRQSHQACGGGSHIQRRKCPGEIGLQDQ